MGSSNTSCLISGLSIGAERVVCTLLAPTKKQDRMSNGLGSENKFFYPLTMPFIGKYDPDEFSLSSYEKTPWTENLVEYFKKGVKEDKKSSFDIIALLQCINDHRNDDHGLRATWFDIKDPNELCLLTKQMEIAYIHLDIFEELVAAENEEKANKDLGGFLQYITNSLTLISEYRSEGKEFYWHFENIEKVSHDLFLDVNENMLRELFETKDETLMKELINPFRDWLTCSNWLFNLGRPWVPASWSPKNNQDRNILTLAKIITKVAK